MRRAKAVAPSTTTEQLTATEEQAIRSVETLDADLSPDQFADALEAATEETPKPEQTPKAAKPVPTPEQALETARLANPERYALVEAVTEQTPKGEPKRVRIRCSDPQTKLGVSVCEGTREIATQDLFQVRCCAACADRIVRRARRDRAKRRERTIKAELAAMRAAQAV